jgi:Zn ribbon nucleic-acid-binding protein
MADAPDPWQEYRRRRNLFLFVFFAYVPLIGVFGVVAKHVGTWATAIVYVISAGWIIFIVAAAIRLRLFKCPRCRSLFFSKWWYGNVFARRCVHCGLSKYASVPAASRELQGSC